MMLKGIATLTYEEWNREIIRNILFGSPRGTTVFLMVDETLLRRIGERFGIDADDAAKAFCDAVRNRTVKSNGYEIVLTSCLKDDMEGYPLGVAFLGLMVLAATKMGEQEKDEKDYFSHFRNLLRIQNSQHGRPEGMYPGTSAEEPLWFAWKQYLQRQGYFSAARPGEAAYRYLRYPLSQALLRYTDRDKLRSKFEQDSWYHQHRDADLLMAQLMAYRDTLTKPLSDLMRSTGQRYAAATSAVHELHTEFVDARSVTPGVVIREREMPAGLICLPGGLGRPSIYALLPRLRASDLSTMGQAIGKMEVQINDVWESLTPDQELVGFCQHVGEWNALSIGHLLAKANGSVFPLRNVPMYNEIKLPPRGFHILVSDPDDPGSGIYRSGRQIAPDIHFRLLTNREKYAGMQRLKKAGKLDWQSERCLGDSGWYEFTDCMILDQDWSHLRDGDVELFNALRPRHTTTLGLSGGLRLPGGAYLVDNAPTLTVYGTRARVLVQLYRLTETEEKHLWLTEVNAREPINLPQNKMTFPGIYLLAVGEGDDQTQRLLSLVDWNSLHRTKLGAEPLLPASQASFEVGALLGFKPECAQPSVSS